MVVLTIVSEKKGEPLFFADPIPQVHFMRLLSCSLYNSWDTLKEEGSANVELKQNVKSVSKVPPGHYDLQSLAKEISFLLARYGYLALKTEINQPLGQLVIMNSGARPIELDRDLAALLGIERKLPLKTVVKRLTSPSTYFIHCDLIDKTQNLWNGERSDLLAVFDLKGKPFENVTYLSPPQQVA